MSTAVEQIVTPYHQTNRFTLYEGDCRSMLSIFADNSFDSIVTDPPAGISFMGKDWDHHKGGRDQWVAWLTEVMGECLRVLKPGGHALVWAIPRTSHWTGWAIESAGFEVRDRVSHLFGSGFPKSLDVSKSIDRLQRRNYVLAAIDLGLNVPGNSLHDWTKAEHSPGDAWWEKFKSHLKPEQWQEIERRVIGEKRKGETSIFGNGKGAALLSEPATDTARQWEGWGTALKPACEDWWLCRKPLEGTVAQTVLEHGTGGLNIGGCRIETGDQITPFGSPRKSVGGLLNKVAEPREGYEQSELGRWPANVTHDGSDEVLAAFPDAPGQQGDLSGHSKDRLSKGIFGDMKAARDAVARLDSGSAARFFYCAKASQEDRNEGLDDLPILSAGAGRTNGSRNVHPTVKPTELMRYLCRLVTPPGGLILDPFMGSGSTGKAAMLEGFKFVGIELNAEYCELAQRRIEAVTRQGLLFA